MVFEAPRNHMPLAARLVLAIIGGLVSAAFALIVFVVFGALVTPVEPVDWSTRPLEVVVDSLEADPCTISVDAVAPGRHDVAVIATESRSVVTIKDSADRVVLRAHAEPRKEGVGQQTVPLELGIYEVRCRSDEGTDVAVELAVRPASELE